LFRASEEAFPEIFYTFLVLFSAIWIPVFVLMCWAEERDLLIRYGNAYEEYRRRTGLLVPRRR
jgi:protein-S-isoprenylcysteine O-methyltransferase Ste14